VLPAKGLEVFKNCTGRICRIDKDDPSPYCVRLDETVREVCSEWDEMWFAGRELRKI
jgi:hypothetical protein